MTGLLPLSHIRVLDLTVARAGPTAVRLLSDWGAHVIKIEQPGTGERSDGFTGPRRGSDEQNLHRNKRSITLDLKDRDGRRIFYDLVRQADVLVENFRPGVKARLGADYETLREINPRLVLASISGYGQSGPYAERPAVDQIVQGMSGLMSITGEPGYGPMRVGIAISDTAAGMFLGQGILLALIHREKSGQGQWVHTSLLESLISKLDFQAVRYTVSGEVPPQEGNHHPTAVPMGAFEASDGLVNIAASTVGMWSAFCKALEAGKLEQDPGFATVALRAENKEDLRAEVSELVARFTVLELVQRLSAAGVPCGPIYDIGEAFEDPHIKSLGMTISAAHPKEGDLALLRSPINLSRFPPEKSFDRPAPDAGADTDEVLTELGLDGKEIGDLRTRGVIE